MRDKYKTGLKPEERLKDPWNILKGNGELYDYDKKPGRYRGHTKEEWWKLMANGFADGGDCEDLFWPIVTADCNILRTGLLSVFDDLCDTKEHADDFFRCHPSADYIHKNTYLIRSTIHGYGTPKDVQDRRGDAWHLCCEKMDELVKKWYGVEKWGQQKIGKKKFDKSKMKPLSWKDQKFEKVFVCADTGETIRQPDENPKFLAGSRMQEKYIIDRPIYVKKCGSNEEVFIGYCRNITSGRLECGHIRRYDPEDMRYYTNSISFSTQRIVFHENTKDIIERVRKTIGKKDIGVKFHLMTQCADNGDGWHELGGTDEEVSKYNNTIFFSGTGFRTREDGLHLNAERGSNWRSRITIYEDRVVISDCEVAKKQILDFKDKSDEDRERDY